jgi:hypothetical protein
MSFSDLTGLVSSVPEWDRDESEIRALPIVLDLEKSLDLSHEDALLATAAAIRDYFLSEEIRDGGDWHEATSLWLDGRIRKLAKRARASAWDAVTDVPGVIGSYGDAVVWVMPPTLVTDQNPAVKKLQVQGLDLPSRPIESDDRAEILIALNPEVEMTTGKSMAQVGHAVQLAIMSASAEQLFRWELDRPVITLVSFESRESWGVEVRDAGFTEVAPNTLTVVAHLI